MTNERKQQKDFLGEKVKFKLDTEIAELKKMTQAHFKIELFD